MLHLFSLQRGSSNSSSPDPDSNGEVVDVGRELLQLLLTFDDGGDTTSAEDCSI